ncbi:hypothetical protein ASD04_04990 [Devosia sp. Root436]|uniref:SH3 domain-containing protein n=1 Tax=Devosia sp. Root436 TaxID=1736537 RepID=UPI0006F3EDFD|nr:SH3 domain-containing protein [Devosia sp. Root436]KQX40006.1 hypothetical protein ASD04_04990 [Devosia sp. Root436]
MRPLALAALLACIAAPALAAPTARVSGGNIAVHTGPGMRYPTIGRIPDGTEVTLDYCTRDDEWCFVTDTGWVLGSYLVGWAAKIPVTPPNFAGPGW